MKKVLIITENPIDFDNRIKAQINFLKNKGYDVSTLVLNQEITPFFSFNIIQAFKKIFHFGFFKILNILIKNKTSLPFFIIRHHFKTPFRHLEKFCKNGIERIAVLNPDFIIANDLVPGVLAYNYKRIKGIPYWYDSHEFQIFRNYKNSWIRALVSYYYEKKVVLEAKRVSTVSNPISEYYKELYGRNPYVFNNNFFEKKVSRNVKYENDKKNVLVYFGCLNKGRGIKYWPNILKLINAEKILVFSNTPNDFYFDKNLRVEFRHPFKSIGDHLIIQLNKYNCYGLCLIEDICLSYKYSLPNKYFEYKALGIKPIVMKGTYLDGIVHHENSGFIYNRENNKLENIKHEK